MIEEFMEVLTDQCLVLQIKVQDTKSPFLFGPTNHLPSSKRRVFLSDVLSTPKTMPSIFINLIDNPSRKEVSTHVESG